MADTTVASGLTVQQWDDKYFREFIDEGGFKAMMGTDENSIIQVKEDLTKKPGDSVTFALVNRLTNAATTGSTVLEGNEEDLVSRSMRVYVDKRRNGVRVSEMNEQKSAISLRSAAKAQLMSWSIEDYRDQCITALGSLASTGTNSVSFVNRTAAIGDAWLVNNKSRTVFGAYAYGGSAGGTDLSADLGQLDTTNDLFNFSRLDDMIMCARTSSPKIRPIRDGGNGRRYYVALAHPAAFRDFRNSIDTEVLALTRDESEASKLFEGGDLMWNGVIVKQIDDLPVYSNIGNGSAEVTPVYLLGAQALAYASAKRWTTATEDFDYGDKHGVAVESIYGVRKLIFGSGTGDTTTPLDNGVVTGFFATTAAGTANGLNATTGTSAEVA